MFDFLRQRFLNRLEIRCFSMSCMSLISGVLAIHNRRSVSETVVTSWREVFLNYRTVSIIIA